jgi:hypothetical protein
MEVSFIVVDGSFPLLNSHLFEITVILKVGWFWFPVFCLRQLFREIRKHFFIINLDSEIEVDCWV